MRCVRGVEVCGRSGGVWWEGWRGVEMSEVCGRGGMDVGGG